MHTRHAIIGALLAVSLLAGCGSDDASEVVSGDDSTTTEAPMDDDTTSSTSGSGSAATGGAEVAAADLATYLGVEPDEVEVVSVDAVTWRDSSVGCPQKGFMYQQVVTEGTRIILEVDGTRYQYHSGGTGDPFRCADPQEPLSVG